MTKRKLQPIEPYDNDIFFEFPLQIVPKARPRFSRKGSTYMPNNYVDNQSEIVSMAIPQFHDSLACVFKNPTEFIVSRCKLSIEYFGNARGDADNISGSILDALVKAKVLEKDNVNCVHTLFFEYGGKGEHHPITYVSLSEIALRPIAP